MDPAQVAVWTTFWSQLLLTPPLTTLELTTGQYAQCWYIEPDYYQYTYQPNDTPQTYSFSFDGAPQCENWYGCHPDPLIVGAVE